MKYIVKRENYRNFHTISVNELPGRSYFIPFENEDEERKTNLLNKRFLSSAVACLSGTWDFKYYENPNDLPETVDTDILIFDKIDVPSCWQFRGYGKPAYINVRYPFRYDPPHIPELESVGGYFSIIDGFKKAPQDEYNHIGLYRTWFDAKKDGNKYILSFLGVCSCLDVYVNGAFIGYAEGSHNTHEFDVTEFVGDGKNELLVLVHRWCNGTYLECQDMFRNNGIFRDVLLRKEGRYAVKDYDFTASYRGGKYDVKVAVDTYEDISVEVSLDGNGISEKKAVKTKNGKAVIDFTNLDVAEWNAENPVLYDLKLATEEQFIHARVGFKRIEVKGDLYLLNGKKIKFHGVNHHDTTPKNGYAMTAEEIDTDLRLIKEYNCDTVRTAHYPPDPLLLELAAEYGIYIIDEADLETHGVFEQKIPISYNWLSDDKKWIEHFVQRAKKQVSRDKALTTPVVMWSIGNESGAGCCTDAMYEYYKSTSHADIPVHYESAVHNKKIMAYDIASHMYPETERVRKIGAKEDKETRLWNRPYFLCEYAHAMGVGPGNIEEYWDSIYKYDGLIGGCIWEFADHAFEHEDGSYTYGGDHGEWIHDGNFCCDGVFYPDRTPSTGAYIMKHCYSPLRIRLNDDKTLNIFNTSSFTPGDAFKLYISLNGKSANEYIVSCMPLSSETLNLALDKLKDECIVNIETVRTSDGKVLDINQFIINENVQKDTFDRCRLPAWFKLENGKPVIALKEGNMTASDDYTLLYRSATDNDIVFYYIKPMPLWYNQKETVIGEKKYDKGVKVTSVVASKAGAFLIEDTYEGIAGGVLVASKIRKISGAKYLPRFAKAFCLPESFEDVKYFGKTGETYLDMKDQFITDEVEAKVSDMTEKNIRPQESGNRMDCRYVEISSGSERIRIEAVDKTFELGVKPYSDKELTNMKHRSDEKASGTYVAVSAFQQGIGTGSCGPNTLWKHKYLSSIDYELKFIIRKE